MGIHSTQKTNDPYLLIWNPHIQSVLFVLFLSRPFFELRAKVVVETVIWLFFQTFLYTVKWNVLNAKDQYWSDHESRFHVVPPPNMDSTPPNNVFFFLLLTFLSKMKKERKKRNRHFLTWKRISRCLAFWTRWKNPHNRTSCHFLIAAIPTIASRCRNSHFCHFFFVIYSCVLNFLFLSPPFGCSSKVLLTTLDNRRGQEDPLF
jgi:hypothetical protein